MRKRHSFGIATIMVGAALLAACSSSQPVVDETVMLAYCKEPTTANLENLSKNYSSIINKSRKTGMKQPGVYSDYAVTLVKQGRRAEANSWFNREMSEFAASREYVMQLKRLLIPEFQNDNTIKTDSADTVSVDTESALSPESRAKAEEKAQSVMDEKEKKSKKNKK